MSDLIRREDAIGKIREVYEYEFPTASGEFDEFATVIIPNLLRNLPSAEPERKKGKWVKDEHTYSGPTTYNYVCSACGAIGGSWLRDLPKNLMYPFCPHCGADMMRGEDGKA